MAHQNAAPAIIVGANVRAELGRRNRTQTWLAQQLGLTQASVSFRITGRTPIDVDELVRIAHVLDVSLDCLLAGVAAPALAEAATA